MPENSYGTSFIVFKCLKSEDSIMFSRNSDGYYPHMPSVDG